MQIAGVYIPNSIHSPMIVVGTDDPSTSASTQLLIFGYIEETRYIFTHLHVNMNVGVTRAACS